VPKIVKEIEQSHTSIKSWGVVGYCWGGKVRILKIYLGDTNGMVCQIVALTSQSGTPFKAAAAVHPAMVDPKDAPGVTIPMCMIPSQGEDKNDVEAYQKALKVKNVVEWFPDQLHGFMSARYANFVMRR